EPERSRRARGCVLRRRSLGLAAECPGKRGAQWLDAGPRREVDTVEAQLLEPRARRVVERSSVRGEFRAAGVARELDAGANVPRRERRVQGTRADRLAAERRRREFQPDIGRYGSRSAREARDVARLGGQRARERARE